MTGSNDLDGHQDDCGGHCKGCRHWQADHGGTSEDAAVGLCMQPELTHYSLQVSGGSGCNRFESRVEAEMMAGAGV